MMLARQVPHLPDVGIAGAGPCWPDISLKERDDPLPSGDNGGLMTESYDVMIGSGAGGEMLAQTLAGPGKSILLLERGDLGPVPARAAP